jgi:hypothetical protein
MLRRCVFDRVGGFDESLAVAFNDVDFCLRIGQTGLRVVYTPFATLRHHESASVGRPEKGHKVDEVEIQRMLTRWGPLLRSDPYYNPNLPLDREDFASAVIRNYRLGTDATFRRRMLEIANMPWWPLLQMGIQVLRSEGPASLMRDTLRYFRSRI